MADYEQYYRNLNPEQRQAVDNIDGPVMLVAGPGSGKTQVLSLRIANIIKNHPDMAGNILALTYTDAAASNMKDRLSKLVGRAGDQVNITTFHGFCNDLIATRPDVFLTARQMSQIDDLGKFSIVREIIATGDFKELTNIHNPDLYVRDILSAISNLKREAVTPQDYQVKVASSRQYFTENAEYAPKTGKLKAKWATLQKQIDKNTEFSVIYQLYNERLTTAGLYDYDDMINFVLIALKQQPEFLADVQERYQYILVDEYQDTNGAQNQVVLTICSYEEPNIFVVGDEDQSIYSFQGANLNNMLDFRQLFPSCIVISTKINYRSTQPILAAAKSLIDNSTQRIEGIDKQLLSSRQEVGGIKPKLLKFADGVDEYRYILSQLRSLIDSGQPAESIAVIYRTHKDILPLVSMLNSEGIEYKTESGNNILELPAIIKFINTLRWLTASGKDTDAQNLDLLTLFALLNQTISSLDFYKLVRASRGNDLVDILSDTEQLRSLGVAQPAVINQSFSGLLEKFRQSWTMPALEILGELVLSSKLAAIDNMSLSSADTSAFLRLINFCKARDKLSSKLYTLADLLRDLESMKANNLPLKSSPSQTGVHLVTAHSAKGKEYKYVFIIKAIDKNWGNKQDSSKFKLLEDSDSFDPVLRKKIKLEEELRLFYVAVTRSMDFLTISYSENYSEGERTRSANPSMFLGMIEPNLLAIEPVSMLAQMDGDSFEKTVKAELASDKFSAPDLASYLKEIVENTELSFTSLQNYFDCPHRFLYLNLLKLPTPKVTPMIIGSAIHKALENFAQAKKKGETLSLIELQAAANKYLDSESLNPEEKTGLKSSVSEHLEIYYSQLLQWASSIEPAQIISTEFNFRSITVPGVNAKLTGKIDLIEKQAAGTFNLVDYKTGKPLSRNVITGETKSEREIHYLDQLTFYSILCQYDPHKRFSNLTTTIRFTSANPSGKFKEEVFEISSEQKKTLIGRIALAVEEIQALRFERKCMKPDCLVCGRFN